MRADAIGLPITLDLEGHLVVLIGDGDDAETAHKRALAADAGARLTELAPAAFTPATLDGARLVLVATRAAATQDAVFAAARARGVLCWCSDRPSASDLALPAIARLGAARLAVSTGGRAPALSSRLRAALEDALGARFGRFVDALGDLRARVLAEEPDAGRRRQRLRAALDGFALEVAARYPAWFDDADADEGDR